ncbi:Hypothetical predicted protein [Octopus vulgaris]|uniref:DNA replication ATP-dependent helicase/nuclease DNA2 n=1 Tax=Octopus vulgaris TaxID=6645 RepID=A0AA36AEW7_OCTVU|nr:Hypothetical predicted protein [Octopus vulgaris]
MGKPVKDNSDSSQPKISFFMNNSNKSMFSVVGKPNFKNRLRLSKKASTVYVAEQPENFRNSQFKACSQTEISKSPKKPPVSCQTSTDLLLFKMYGGQKQKITDTNESNTIPDIQLEGSCSKRSPVSDLTNFGPYPLPTTSGILKSVKEETVHLHKSDEISEVSHHQTCTKNDGASDHLTTFSICPLQSCSNLSESMNAETVNLDDSNIILETPVKKTCIKKANAFDGNGKFVQNSPQHNTDIPGSEEKSEMEIFSCSVSPNHNISNFPEKSTSPIFSKQPDTSHCFESDTLGRIQKKSFARSFLSSSSNLESTVESRINKKADCKSKLKSKILKKSMKKAESLQKKDSIVEYTAMKLAEPINKPLTPVKNYTGLSGTSVKRLAVSGCSPLSKRSLSSEFNKTELSLNTGCSIELSNLFLDNGDDNENTQENHSFSEAYSDEQLAMWENLNPDPNDVWEQNDSLKSPIQNFPKNLKHSSACNELKKSNVKNNLSVSTLRKNDGSNTKNKVFDWLGAKTNMVPKKLNNTNDTFLSEILAEIPVAKSQNLSKGKQIMTEVKNNTEKIPKSEPCIENGSVINDNEILSEILKEINSSDKGLSNNLINPNHIQSNIFPDMKGNHSNDVNMQTSTGISLNDTSKNDNANLVDVNLKHIQDKPNSSTSFSPVPKIKHISCVSNSNISSEPQSKLDEENIELSQWNSSFDFDDEFCDDIKNLSPFKSKAKTSKDNPLTCSPVCSLYNRYQINDVKYQGQDIELVLTNQDHTISCVLHGFWCYSYVAVGDIVHVLDASTDSAGVYHITDETGLLVINPDFLVSSTTVVSSLFCMRKAVLNERFRGIDKGNLHMLYGSIVHCLLQEVLRNKIFKEKEIILLTKSIMKRKYILHEIYGHGTDESVVLAAVLKYIPNIVKWIEHHTNFMKQQSDIDVRRTIVTSVCDIEENIWSPRFGLKGKIDLTVEIKTHHLKRKVVPLELKTGNPSFSAEHKGQVTLYTMMMSDRREDPKEGLLLYLKDQPNMSPVSTEHQNKRGLIQLRNEILYYIQNSLLRENSLPDDLSKLLGKLPEPINNVSACSKCPHLLSCSIYQNFSLDVGNMTKNRKELHQTSLSHLSQSHINFFIHWCVMIEFEKQSSIHGEGIRDIWCSTGIDSLHQTFEPINTVGLNVHDSVAISVEDKQQIVICRGYIYSMSEDYLVVMCDRSFDDHLNINTEIFKVDKCSDWENWGTCYNNLITLMADTAHSARLRQLIIDHEKPRVHSTLAKSTVQKVKSIFKPLNKLQKVALLKVNLYDFIFLFIACFLNHFQFFMSEDYVLIRGYPGTGKTSTIVALIQMLVASGVSILVASFTHSAVDNILLKLRKEKIQFLRMGRKDRIHPDIYPYSADELTKNAKSVQELKTVYESMNVVATTCVGMSHTLFSQCQRQFDVCIIDESSQVMLPMCLGPLFAAKKFILVGDSKQLPPIVQSDQAKSLGMDKSLFVELEDKGATVQLNLQYRMNREIMLLSNELIYEGCLQCGNEEVATRTLQPSKCIKRKSNLPSWMLDVVNGALNKAVLFLNTKMVPAPETYNTRGEVQNNIEAQLIAMIVSVFQTDGMCLSDIGVIAPYRNQVKLVHQTLINVIGKEAAQYVEVNTVDQYQGRDKDIIIVTFVRSSSKENLKSCKAGGILKDIRRLNVAMTRAKCKLIFIGNVETLEIFKPLADLMTLLSQRQLISFVYFCSFFSHICTH